MQNNIKETSFDTSKKEEVELIRSVFKDNDTLLLSMRALIFGLDITEEEKQTIKSTFSNDALFDVVRERFCPQISRKTPIGTVSDDWLGATQMVFGQTKDTIKQAIEYKAKALRMAKRAVALLRNPNEGTNDIDINYDHNEDDNYEDDNLGIGLLARNQFIQFIESQLLGLKTIANMTEETSVEQAKRIMKDSSK